MEPPRKTAVERPHDGFGGVGVNRQTCMVRRTCASMPGAAFVLGTCACTCVSAQTEARTQSPEIYVGPNVLVSSEGYPHVEPHLAINPRDPQNLFAAAMTFPVPGHGARVRYASFDGGKRWSAQWADTADGSDKLSQDDPQVVFSSDGIVYLPHLLAHLYRSTDGGRTWAASISSPPKACDLTALVAEGFTSTSPSLAVDRSAGPHRGRVYAAWAGLAGARGSYLSHSDDGGTTWSKPVTIVKSEKDRRLAKISVAVNLQGAIALTWSEYVPKKPTESRPYKSGRPETIPSFGIWVSMIF